MNGIRTGYLVGNGAAQNVELGWIPELVIITNATDGDVISIGHIGPDQIVPFTSGGTTEIVAGDKIEGATSGAKAWVKEILSYSGSWAAGDIAGFMVVEMISGTFESENVFVGAGTNDATVTANVTHSVSIDTEVATVTGTSAITPYVGASGAAKGFTAGAVICEEAKLLRYVAFRGDQ